MRIRRKEIDVLGSARINEATLLSEVNIEISLLKGLDIFTNAHVQGVAKTTLAMCKKMNMSYEEIKKCVVAAYLHDIGKTKIPPEILQKTAKLTDEEYKEMKNHTIYGYEMCMNYPTFHKYAAIIRAHHENLDGTGYPDGLKGDEIPPEASLIKVADVYDALTQRRQYKSGFARSEALSIMFKDVIDGKMLADYFEILILVVVDKISEEYEAHAINVLKLENNLEILHELERIYKQIYDMGLTPKLEKKLRKFELAPGYDMSTNANLLIIKQKALEREKEAEKKCEAELSAILKIKKELYKWNRVNR
mgnify:CR=1 FL=1